MTISTLPYPRHIGIKHVKSFVLPETLYLEQWQVPKDTTVRIYQSQNFGVCVLPQDTHDQRGFTIPRRIFRH